MLAPKHLIIEIKKDNSVAVQTKYWKCPFSLHIGSIGYNYSIFIIIFLNIVLWPYSEDC